jgi:hypothetical protein
MGHVMTDGATGGRAEQTVVTGEMAGDSTEDSTLDASLGVGPCRSRHQGSGA